MKNRKGYLLYFISVIFLFLFLYITINVFEKREEIYKNSLYKKFVNYDEILVDNIVVPRFDFPVIDKKIDEIVKELEGNNLSFNVFVNKDYISLFFLISNKRKYYNINYSIKDNEFISNDNVFDLNSIRDFILDNVKHKYSSDIYNIVTQDNLKSTYLKITEEDVIVYFDSSLFKDISYSVSIKLKGDFKVVNDTVYDKVIAFTFDDGPSQYTMDIVKALVLNDSKATFFELGNRMKYNQDIVREVLNNGMEIGSHTYAHKSLTSLNDDEVLEEVNSTNIIYNEITGENIKLLRPPYGSINERVKDLVVNPIINWNIDTNDWLYRDSDVTAVHIIKNAKDGDIILMHDIYPETLEAVKKVLPILREMGFKVTTVSELASIKDVVLEPHQVYRSIK